MRFTTAATLGLSGILMMSACSTSSDEPAKKNVNGTANGNSNVVVVANTSEVNEAYPVDANSAAFTGKRIESPGDRGKQNGGVTISPADALEMARKTAQPAPDNSTFFSYLGDAGYEIRTFNDHPQLLRVEKKTTSEGKGTAKIFLRGGRVVQIDGNKIEQLSTAPAQMLLGLAGVSPKQTPLPGGLPAEKKPSE